MRSGDNDMLKSASSHGLVLGLALCGCFLILLPVAYARTDRAFKRQLQETMEKVRNGNSLAVRAEAARQLEKLTEGIAPQKVDDQTLAELVSLLDSRDDPVRYWVAVALGDLGPRAKMAIPKLLKVLVEVDCLVGALTSAAAIRGALKRIGQTPPPMPNCYATKRSGVVAANQRYLLSDVPLR